MRFFVALLTLVLALPAFAQITALGLSFQAQSSANTTDSNGQNCSDQSGGVGVSAATSSCSDLEGNTAAASAQANATSDARGADFSLVAQVAATAAPPAPGVFSAQGNASASTTALENWSLAADTFYSFAGGTASDSEGASTANVFATFSGGVTPSGQLAAGVYSLQASASANAFPIETGELTGAASASASTRITFAEASSSTLIKGIVQAGGLGQPGLLVEAFDGAALIDSALTGDDGSYLLPAVTTSVTVRISDPAGNFFEVESALLTPPTTFDTNLPAATAVPSLRWPFLAVLALAMAAVLVVLPRTRRPTGR